MDLHRILQGRFILCIEMDKTVNTKMLYLEINTKFNQPQIIFTHSKENSELKNGSINSLNH